MVMVSYTNATELSDFMIAVMLYPKSSDRGIKWSNSSCYCLTSAIHRYQDHPFLHFNEEALFLDCPVKPGNDKRGGDGIFLSMSSSGLTGWSRRGGWGLMLICLIYPAKAGKGRYSSTPNWCQRGITLLLANKAVEQQTYQLSLDLGCIIHYRSHITKNIITNCSWYTPTPD